MRRWIYDYTIHLDLFVFYCRLEFWNSPGSEDLEAPPRTPELLLHSVTTLKM